MYKTEIKKNVASLITIFRLILCFILIPWNERVFCNDEGTVIITLVFILAWTSDFIDGRIARKLGIASKFGANLDLFVDCVFVFTLNLQLVYFKLIPFVFILIMVEKIANYLITSKILNSMYVSNSYYWNDKIGRVVSASFFVVPWFGLILNSVGLVFCNLIIIVTIRLIIGFSIISSFGRYYRIIKTRRTCN